MTDQGAEIAFRRELVGLVPKLRRFALSLSGNPQDADDLVQAACEKALKNRSQFQPGTRMDSWMYRIVQTLWLDDRRRHKVRGTAIDPDDAQDVVDHMNQMERSGRIDMDAYRGERSDDDEPETLGEAALEPDDIDSHGNRSRNPG